jgi:hypothetical protein
MTRVLLALSACCVLVGVGPARAAAKITRDDLRQIGLAYHAYHDANARGPANGDDLGPYFDAKDRKRLVDAVNLARVVFIFNVRLQDMTEGTSNTVLAYVQETPRDGGLVLYGDASIKILTADEFKKATLAKAKDKPKDK